MKNTKSTWFVLFVAMISILWMPSSQAGCGANINNDVQKIIDDIRLQYQIPGIEVSISCPEESSPRDFVSGTITKDGTELVKSDNYFQIGSETKSFTTSILLQLVRHPINSVTLM